MLSKTLIWILSLIWCNTEEGAYGDVCMIQNFLFSSLLGLTLQSKCMSCILHFLGVWMDILRQRKLTELTNTLSVYLALWIILGLRIGNTSKYDDKFWVSLVILNFQKVYLRLKNSSFSGKASCFVFEYFFWFFDPTELVLPQYASNISCLHFFMESTFDHNLLDVL